MRPTPSATRVLTRSRSERLLAGVCGGLAEHLQVSALAVRITMGALTLVGGAGALLYLWLWGTVPVEAESEGMEPLRRALTKPAERLADPVPGPAPVPEAPREQTPAPSQMPAPETSPGQAHSHSSALGEPMHDPSQTSVLGAAGAAGTGQPVQQGVQPPRSERPASPAQRDFPQASAPSVFSSVSAYPGLADTAAGPEPATASPRGRWPVAELLFGCCLLLVGMLLVVRQFGVELRLSIILPGLAVLVGVGLTWWQIADRNRPDANQVPRVLGALALVAVGVLMFFVTAENPNVWTVIAAAVAALAGVALAIAPWLLRLNRELIAERAGRAREAERSEIAAHLHDSVLQTLALIQQRSEPGSEVARIARGQERELREWLFRGADGGAAAPQETALEELRAHAAALEDSHAVRFETVGVGAEVVVPEPIVAAAKEAMLNAARHAGGEVTVYAEVTRAGVSIDVTDRGPGLDLEQLPEGRMGVRESILGRMSRAGGTAKIVPGPGGSGTAVRLELPREHTDEPVADPGGRTRI